LKKLLDSQVLSGAPSVCRFLSYTVDGVLDGNQNQLKEYAIGVAVFNRGDEFDPRLDPIVRVQARKLRLKLKEYYETAGASDPLLIELPKGSYVPAFSIRPAEAPPPQAPGAPERRPKLAAACGLVLGSPACRKWRLGAVGAATLAFVLAASIWLLPARGFQPAAAEAHIGIAFYPAEPRQLDPETVSLCTRLVHDVDDALEELFGLRASDGGTRLTGPRPRPQPGSSLRGAIRRIGDRVRIDAVLLDGGGSPLWTGTYERGDSELHEFSHTIARDIVSDRAFLRDRSGS
jgi:hypothetical protein